MPDRLEIVEKLADRCHVALCMRDGVLEWSRNDVWHALPPDFRQEIDCWSFVDLLQDLTGQILTTRGGSGIRILPKSTDAETGLLTSVYIIPQWGREAACNQCGREMVLWSGGPPAPTVRGDSAMAALCSEECIREWHCLMTLNGCAPTADLQDLPYPHSVGGGVTFPGGMCAYYLKLEFTEVCDVIG